MILSLSYRDQTSALSARKIAVALTLLVAACDDPKAATNNNFVAALKPVVAANACRQEFNSDVPDGDPLTQPALPVVRRSADRGGDKRQLAILNRYTDAGVLARSEAIRPVPSPTGVPIPTRVLVYTPTAAGADIVIARRVLLRKSMVNVPLVCIGRGEVVAIDSATTPADAFGYKITVVTYRWRRTGLSAAQRAIAEKIEPEIAATLDRDQSARATLVETAKGWVDRETLGL
ncbi:MAG: hypothetical protein ACRYG4_28965 [Janthinobacterium lividum]